ncbi:SDR family NAD(P)-dependent oxidoreductase [Janthinobacterium lividum]|uniref:SDR family NAD(P)-dependent oxidoreductase n=1 Tax=Janthinobacterium lividum TaxID=29581 RepID=UPI00140800D8|nr:SDR family oxidoreductase [Janthinobacterium lividum]NHQ91284.1 SDR family oxidoreductase [Janthinobacterium lividum]
MNAVTTQGTALITGASSGLGAVYADRLAARGFDLILVARRVERLGALAASLAKKYGVAVRAMAADLAAPADLQRVAEELAGNPAITMLVNNAGVSTLGAVVDSPREGIAAMDQVNVAALAQLTYAVLPQFKQRNSGTIINIGSVLSFHILPVSTIYSATKGYVMNFTRGLQQELAGTGITVQLVLPASTATEIWELSGVPLAQLDQATIMRAEDCVDAALAGLDQGELVTLPSVEDQALWERFDAARLALFAGAMRGQPASRYGVKASV